MSIQPKNIFEYDNYRVFLKEFIELKRSQDKKYSYRYFAKIAGFKACNVLNRIIDGERNLATDSIEKIIKALKLGHNESVYFRNLVLLNQAKDEAEKTKYAQEIIKSRAYKRLHPLKESQYNFCSNWYYVVIWESVSLAGFKPDPEWIAKKLSPSITPSEARRAIEEMIQLGLLSRTADGRLEKVSQNITSPDEVASASIARWHQSMMKRAAESISRVPRDERDISSVTFAVSKSLAKKIKERIQQFRKEVVEMQKTDGEGADAVYQLNLQLFPQISIDEEDQP